MIPYSLTCLILNNNNGYVFRDNRSSMPSKFGITYIYPLIRSIPNLKGPRPSSDKRCRLDLKYYTKTHRLKIGLFGFNVLTIARNKKEHYLCLLAFYSVSFIFIDYMR